MASDNTHDQALHFASAKGDVDAMRQALSQGADVNVQSPHMWDTPLHVAVMNRSVDAIHLLLDAGAELDIPNRDGRTALHEAAFTYQKDPQVWQLLVEHGARTDIPDHTQQTPQQLLNSLVYGPALMEFSKELGDRALELDRSRGR